MNVDPPTPVQSSLNIKNEQVMSKQFLVDVDEKQQKISQTWSEEKAEENSLAGF